MADYAIADPPHELTLGTPTMTAGSEWRRAVVGAIAGLLYGLLLAFLSFGAIGAGHGTLIPLIVSSAPLGVAYPGAGSDAERGAALFTCCSLDRFYGCCLDGC
jgi:hypothetical protein